MTEPFNYSGEAWGILSAFLTWFVGSLGFWLAFALLTKLGVVHI